MLLISNIKVKNYEEAKEIYHIYLLRSKIEAVFKFLKDVLGWEEVQVRDGESIKNLMVRKQIQNGNTYVGKEYNTGSHFDGPTTATHQYNEVEWLLGSYATKIRVDSINPKTGATTVSIVTTNKAHWESASRYQGALKNRKGWDGGDYMFSNHSRNNYPRYEHDLEQPLYESSIYPDRYENTSLRQESFNHELVNPNPQYQGRDVIIPHSAGNDFELHDKIKRAIDNHIEGTFD